MWEACSTPAVQVGEWCFHASTGELCAAVLRRRLEPRVGDVLRVLVDHAGEVVSRAHLFRVVWRDRVVVDEVLTRAICQIRAALGDARSPYRYVETLPKRGYRLIAPVRAECLDVNPWAVSVDRQTQRGGARASPHPWTDTRVPRRCPAPGSHRRA